MGAGSGVGSGLGSGAGSSARARVTRPDSAKPASFMAMTRMTEPLFSPSIVRVSSGPFSSSTIAHESEPSRLICQNRVGVGLPLASALIVTCVPSFAVTVRKAPSPEICASSAGLAVTVSGLMTGGS